MGVGAGIGALTGVAGGVLGGMGKMQEAQTQAKNIEMQGVATGMQDWWEAGQMNIEASLTDLQNSQTDTYLRQQTAEKMANINAVMAVTGSSFDSPSNNAVKNRFQTMDDTQRAQQQWNGYMQSEQDRNQAKLLLMSGMLSMMNAQDNAGRTRAAGSMAGIGSMIGGLGSLGGLFG